MRRPAFACDGSAPRRRWQTPGVAACSIHLRVLRPFSPPVCRECPGLAQYARLYTMPAALVTVICKRLSTTGRTTALPELYLAEESAMSNLNHKFELAARPVGMPKRTDWNYKEEPVRDPGEGEFLVKILYISLDPAMRGWMNEGKSYIAPVGIGEVMRAGALGRVVASNHPGFAVGDHVGGALGAQEYAMLDGAQLNKV